MPNDLKAELEAALSLAETAAEYARGEYGKFVAIPDAPVTISTHVDRGVQEMLLTALRRRFPTDAVLAEEDTPAAKDSPDSDRCWVVDPIDGTRGFAMKTGEFSIMIGLTIRNRVVLGVVAEPVQRRVTYATIGGGCWASGNGEPAMPCRVRTTANLAEAILTQSRSKPGGKHMPVVTALKPASVVETFSAGVKLALVARGEVDCYVNDYSGFNDWDICAGDILVTEAGGETCSFNGEPIAYGRTTGPKQRGLIACTPGLHVPILSAIQGL